ncbi:MAG: hypothetical protein IJ057_12390 [Bacteroidales bacterium]|nr:hypothetical protein [Bacteroidales bacterium]
MKIKELHIRNIASIEKADIDFEHGLNELYTGQPAPVFLITGVTGSGKSALLDGIALALYKKTPRIADVARKVNNKFTNVNGESISINSIEQYTRIGISANDECYSEVVFEGNDGLTYRAKLELGIYYGNTDKTTGKRPLKYRDPKWTVKVDTADWVAVKSEQSQVVLNAIGLTFEQFERMAMLAQGQFAEFLTGDKTVREIILERLTNTQHFSKYGEAIKSLRDKAEKAKDEAEIAYQTDKQHIIDSETLDKLRKQLDDLKTAKTESKKQLAEVDKQLKSVETIESNRHVKTEAEKETNRLQAIKEGEEFGSKKSLVAQWDATVDQRKQLTALNTARQTKQTAEADRIALKTAFVSLSADLKAKCDAYRTLSDSVKLQKEWLDQRQDRATLFDVAGKVDQQLKNLHDSQAEKVKAETETKRLQALVPSLKSDAEQKSQTADEARKKAKDKQDEIDKLIEERRLLNPTQVNDDLTEANSRKGKLQLMENDLGSHEEAAKETENLKHEIETKELEIQELDKARETAENAYDKAKADDDAAQKLLSTMQMSLEEVLVNLRKKLHEEHTETCPLCGQHIHEMHVDEEFQAQLTPLQEAQQKTAQTLRETEQAKDEAKRKFDTAKGTLDSKKEHLAKTLAAHQDKLKKLQGDAEALGLDKELPLLPQVTTEAEKASKRIEELKHRQQQAETLQTQIEVLGKEKKPLDEALTQADRATQEAQTAIADNAKEMDRQVQKAKEETSGIRQLQEELKPLLDSIYVDWTNHIAQTRDSLRQDAQTYKDKKKAFDNASQLQAEKKLEIKQLNDMREDILKNFSEWKDETFAAKPFLCADIHAEWTRLYGHCLTNKEKHDSAERQISEIAPVLEAFYQNSDMTAETLEGIESRQDELDEARRFADSVETQLKSQADAILRADQAIAQMLQELGATTEADLPEKAALEERRKTWSATLQAQAEQMGGVNTLLEANDTNLDKLQKSKAAFDVATGKFNKWERLNKTFGGSRFRTLVQTYILRPLLNNANIYLSQITERYKLTCSEDNEQLSILVLDKENKDQVRSATVLSGGERFMISLALSLALSSLNHPDLNTNILFIDEGFGTLDEKSLDSVMSTLEKLQDIPGQGNRRIGIISHREELEERILVKIKVEKHGNGRSLVKIENG